MKLSILEVWFTAAIRLRYIQPQSNPSLNSTLRLVRSPPGVPLESSSPPGVPLEISPPGVPLETPLLGFPPTILQSSSVIPPLMSTSRRTYPSTMITLAAVPPCHVPVTTNPSAPAANSSPITSIWFPKPVLSPEAPPSCQTEMVPGSLLTTLNSNQKHGNPLWAPILMPTILPNPISLVGIYHFF